MSAEEILNEIAKLPHNERAALARRLEKPLRAIDSMLHHGDALMAAHDLIVELAKGRPHT